MLRYKVTNCVLQVSVPPDSEQGALSGLYWLSSSPHTASSPVYQRTGARPATIYKRGRGET